MARKAQPLPYNFRIDRVLWVMKLTESSAWGVDGGHSLVVNLHRLAMGHQPEFPSTTREYAILGISVLGRDSSCRGRYRSGQRLVLVLVFSRLPRDTFWRCKAHSL